LSVAGPIEGLSYPPLCPSCGAAASTALAIPKVFWFDPGGDTPGGHRIAQANPLFCTSCVARHRAEALEPGLVAILTTTLFSELVIPAVGTLSLGLFMLHLLLPRALGTLEKTWWLLLIACGLVGVGISSFRTAWPATRWKRVPAQTSITRAFDFGDDDTGWFKTEPRTYVIRNAACGAAFARLNEALHAKLTGPEQRSRERRRWWIAATIMVAIAILAWLMEPPPKAAHPGGTSTPLCGPVGDKEGCASEQGSKH